MTDREDPLGRRALFTAPGDRDEVSGVPVAGAGRRAFYSAPPRTPARRVVVECRSCGGRRSLGVVSLAARLTPSLWWPATRHSRYMRCPTCGRFAWCRVRWTSWRPR